MSNDLVNQVVTSVLRRTFPVTVVSRDGTNVVLSQGGQALKEGTRYAMVTMGAEMKDPQTGQSLGRVESPCCELVVERVMPNLSYGRLENVRSNLEQLPIGGLQLRNELKSVAAAKAQSAEDSRAVTAQTTEMQTASPAAGGHRAVQARPAVAPAKAMESPGKSDDKW